MIIAGMSLFSVLCSSQLNLDLAVTTRMHLLLVPMSKTEFILLWFAVLFYALFNCVMVCVGVYLRLGGMCYNIAVSLKFIFSVVRAEK